MFLAAVIAGNFLWEIFQLPLYSTWRTGTLREQTFAVVHCTFGDLLIALALVVAGDERWPIDECRSH
jgi:hypothetical protein